MKLSLKTHEVDISSAHQKKKSNGKEAAYPKPIRGHVSEEARKKIANLTNLTIDPTLEPQTENEGISIRPKGNHSIFPSMQRFALELRLPSDKFEDELKKLSTDYCDTPEKFIKTYTKGVRTLIINVLTSMQIRTILSMSAIDRIVNAAITLTIVANLISKDFETFVLSIVFIVLIQNMYNMTRINEREIGDIRDLTCIGSICIQDIVNLIQLQALRFQNFVEIDFTDHNESSKPQQAPLLEETESHDPKSE